MFGLKILILMVFVLSNSGHSPVHGARILAIFSLASPSHNIFNRVLSRALASRGHEVKISQISESVARKHFRETLLPYLDIQRNFSLLLANIAVGVDEPRPLSSNVIPVGGMHIKSRHEPLPQILQDFLDGAQGFIYFSLGVSIKGEMIDSEKLKLFVDAFSELPLRILWKFETNKMGDLPSNIRIEKWLPQDAILGKIHIFIYFNLQ
ncbi:hypothetical protein ANN_20511 [Periplaneta americana]|uniref:UDP-glucuronosyltransferase n=1 Tax=Periplaneta americana TaxID=6978 RepID=A0ABQ8SD14_PERAM|nr:hypothetical protein ANN_20511 [Periplaneta americana]